MRLVLRFLKNLPLVVLSPVVALLVALTVALADVAWFIAGRRCKPVRTSRRAGAASIVIPNWNGRDLLERYLPSVVAAASANTANEIIVVDNGSADGSAELVRSRFPGVKLLAFDRNLGFGGGSNAGVRAAANDIVVLLNSDMRVAPDFLAPLLEGFADDDAFAVTCQIFFSDPARRREETGLSEAHWRDGSLRVRHVVDDAITDLYPCLYGGGGSTAFDRRRFLELGGFDALLKPFYLEDTDLGYMAWKRGWKVMYQPRSRVWHEHRGTIGKHYAREHVESVYRKNFTLFAWKNIHDWRKLASQFAFALIGVAASAVLGDAPHRANAAALCRAFTQLPRAIRSRWRARSLAVVNDDEAFRRPRGGCYRDRFEIVREGIPARPRVLFISPYPISPPVHGGAVFMLSTLRELVRACEVHLICLLDRPEERAAHEELARQCASAEFLVRMQGRPHVLGSIAPHAVSEFANDDLDWLIHRQILTRHIDVVQIEYTALAQYGNGFSNIAEALFEHDIYFQSVRRAMSGPKTAYEYLRALRFELRALPSFDRIQVCSRENRAYLLQFLPGLQDRIQDNLRAAIDTSRYGFKTSGREPGTILFLGSFRHLPNQAALKWFAGSVLPKIREKRPDARLIVVGSDPPPRYAFPAVGAVELRGLVEDVREPLSRYAAFVCPILSGSGVRVKLLEAFASGIPVVSTHLGAEGIARSDGEFCFLADAPEDFAARLLTVLDGPACVASMADRARREVEMNWDAAPLTRRLVESYFEVMRSKRERESVSGTACA